MELMKIPKILQLEEFIKVCREGPLAVSLLLEPQLATGARIEFAALR